MTETTQVANPMDMVVTTNAAPVEQRSPELVTTETDAPIEQFIDSAPETAEEPIAAEPAPDPKDNDLAREMFQEKLRGDEYKRQLDELKPKDPAPEKEPDINNYRTLDEYKADYKKWAKEEGKREERAAYQQQEQAKEQAKVRANVVAKEQDSRAKHADYDAVVTPLVPVIGSVPILKDFIAKNPMGTEVMYELAKNPAVLDQIMRGDVWEAGERLLNMAARLKKPVAVSVSNAQEPIKPVGSREVVKPKLSSLSDAAYIEARNKQELARRRRAN